MKAYFVRHIPKKIESKYIRLSPRKLLICEVQIVKGGVFIPPNSVIYCTNQGSFAPIVKNSLLGKSKMQSYKIDLGIEKLDIVVIPDHLNTYFIDIDTWDRHKQRCLDLIENNSDIEMLLPTKNALKIAQAIRRDLDEYILGEN